MARKKVEQPVVGDDDLDILHPERIAEVGGKQVEVKEYSFVQGARLAKAQNIVIDKLSGMLLFKREKQEAPEVQDILNSLYEVFAEAPDEMIKLLTEATGEEKEFIETLSQTEGQILLFVWWSVNGPFLIGSAVDRIQLQDMVGQRNNSQ